MNDLSMPEFQRIAAIARERWGLALSVQKVPLVTARISSFLRNSQFETVGAYVEYLENRADEKDMLMFFDLLSTNVTSFFRDRGHFDYLERELFTGIARGNITLPGRRLRMWSAGCSIGCEAYTLAMLAQDHLRDQPGWDVRILATDLSTYAVQEARAATYSADLVKDIPRDVLHRHFEPAGEAWKVRASTRGIVSVALLNLMDQWPMNGPFDVIFCRNVMIYFDAPTRKRLVGRFVSMLRPGGVLAVGSAETLAGMHLGLRAVMPSLYVSTGEACK